MVRINRFLKGLLTVYTVVIALAICALCADIYREAYRPEMLNERGMRMGPVYTPENTGKAVRNVLVLSAAYPALAVGAMLTGNRKKDNPRAENEPEYMLLRLKKQWEILPEDAVREENTRRRLGYARKTVALICVAGSAVYLLNKNNFASWDLEPVMDSMVRHVLPWIIAAFIGTGIVSELERRSALRELTVLRKTPKEAGKQAEAEKRGFPVNAVRWVIFVIAVIFIILGAVNGDPRSVMTKAIRICTECIGLG